jgi:hypothetical protein
MIKAFIIVLLFQLPQTLSDYHIKKVWLFSKTVYMGNVPRSPNGKPAVDYTKKLLCFLEVSKGRQLPEWQTAYFNGNRYSVNAVQLNQDSVVVGAERSTKMPVIIKENSGCKLIQLFLTLKQADTSNKADGFVLDGMLNNNAAHYKSDSPVVELSPDLMP